MGKREFSFDDRTDNKRLEREFSIEDYLISIDYELFKGYEAWWREEVSEFVKGFSEGNRTHIASKLIQLGITDVNTLRNLFNEVNACPGVLDLLLSVKDEEKRSAMILGPLSKIRGARLNEFISGLIPLSTEVKEEILSLLNKFNVGEWERTLLTQMVHLVHQNPTLDILSSIGVSLDKVVKDLRGMVVNHLGEISDGHIDWVKNGSALYDFYKVLLDYQFEDLKEIKGKFKRMIQQGVSLKTLCDNHFYSDDVEVLKKIEKMGQIPHEVVKETVLKYLIRCPHIKDLNMNQLFTIFCKMGNRSKDELQYLVPFVLLTPESLLPRVEAALGSINVKRYIPTQVFKVSGDLLIFNKHVNETVENKFKIQFLFLGRFVLNNSDFNYWDDFFVKMDKAKEEYQRSLLKQINYMVLDSKTEIESLDTGWVPNDFQPQWVAYLNSYAEQSAIKDKVIEVAQLIEGASEEDALRDIKKTPSVIYGGTHDHFVLYVLEGQVFKIYNSGQGATLTEDLTRVKTLKYRNLTSKELNSDFFVNIFNYTRNNCSYEEVAEYIHNSLFRAGKSNLNYSSFHKAQEKGGCVYKAHAFYVHDAIGKAEWRKFKTFFTKDLLDKLKACPKTPNFPITPFQYQTMLLDTEEIYQKRLSKSSLDD